MSSLLLLLIVAVVQTASATPIELTKNPWAKSPWVSPKTPSESVLLRDLEPLWTDAAGHWDNDPDWRIADQIRDYERRYGHKINLETEDWQRYFAVGRRNCYWKRCREIPEDDARETCRQKCNTIWTSSQRSNKERINLTPNHLPTPKLSSSSSPTTDNVNGNNGDGEKSSSSTSIGDSINQMVLNTARTITRHTGGFSNPSSSSVAPPPAAAMRGINRPSILSRLNPSLLLLRRS